MSPLEKVLPQPSPVRVHRGHNPSTSPDGAACEDYAETLAVSQRLPATSPKAEVPVLAGDPPRESDSDSPSSAKPACPRDARRASGFASITSFGTRSPTLGDIPSSCATSQQEAPIQCEAASTAAQHAQPTESQQVASAEAEKEGPHPVAAGTPENAGTTAALPMDLVPDRCAMTVCC